jgi:cytochrome c oxidase cbb3-type subunit 1
MYSTRWIYTHFWLATIGTVLYIASMWVSGLMQGLMWRAVNADGTLTYSFVQEMQERFPYYVVRLLGGIVFFAGMVLMAINVWKTIRDTRNDANENNVASA